MSRYLVFAVEEDDHIVQALHECLDVIEEPMYIPRVPLLECLEGLEVTFDRSERLLEVAHVLTRTHGCEVVEVGLRRTAFARVARSKMGGQLVA